MEDNTEHKMKVGRNKASDNKIIPDPTKTRSRKAWNNNLVLGIIIL